MEFRVGQRVQIAPGYGLPEMDGITGRIHIIHGVDYNLNVGVVFDESTVKRLQYRFHNLDGKVEKNIGRWFRNNELLPAHETKEEALSDLLNKRITEKDYETLI